MSRKLIFVVIAVVTLVSMACGVTINLPVDEINTGPTQEVEISVPEPDVEVVDLTLSFGAGELKVEPGAQGALISGKAAFNVEDFRPEYKIEGASVKLDSGNLDIQGIPKISGDIENKWYLKLSDKPMNLTLHAGAYQGDLELGGLALQSLEVGDGAADVQLKFSQPNLIKMDYLRYTTGASNVRLSGLANTNATSMTFRSGAGDYTLDFSGALSRDMIVNIESGMSQVVIVVPEGMPARVIFKSGMANVDYSAKWEKSRDEYSLEGSGPTLTIIIDLAAGNLELRTSS